MGSIGAAVLPALVMALLGGVAGWALTWLHRRLPRDESGLVARIDALLPQNKGLKQTLVNSHRLVQRYVCNTRCVLLFIEIKLRYGTCLPR